MTIEEYVVKMLNDNETKINKLEFRICELMKEIEEKNKLLSFVADNINLTNLPEDRYYEFTIWEEDNKGNYDRIDEIKRKYGANNDDR